MAERFYPRLSSIVTLDNLPEQLSFIQSGLTGLFTNIHFRDLQFTKSELGDSAFYSLTLISYKSLEIEIPGTGIAIALNPNHNATGITEIPITVSYEWKILRFIRGLQSQDFSFQGQDFFSAITESILGMTGPELANLLVTTWFDAATPLAAIDNFRTDINAFYTVSIPPATSTDPEVALLEVLGNAVLATQKDPFTIIFKVFIEDLDDELTKENVNQLFEAVLGMTPIEYVKDLLIPKIGASLELGVGIIFPRNVLLPLDGSGNPIPEPTRSMLSFASGDFSFSTETGIGYDVDLVANLNHPSAIGNTGMTITLNTAKLDISRKKNIPEATLDGRPDDFIGVYIQEIGIGLPKFWKENGATSTAEIFGKNVIIGTGGLSGTIGIRPNALYTTGLPILQTNLGSTSGFSIGLESFEMTFKQNSILSSSISGFLTIPGFEDAANPGNPAKIDVDVTIGDNTFEVTASTAQGITLKIPNVFEFTIYSLSIGREEDPGSPGDYRFYLDLSGDLKFLVNKPGGGGLLLEDPIVISRLSIYDDGSFEIVGGVSIVPKSLNLKIGPVNFSVTAIHFGTHEQDGRKYAYFGFDGGLSVNPGGVDARGDGVKFYFTVDGGTFDFFFRIEGIAINLMIPGNATAETAALLLSGYLSMKNPDSTANPSGATEYTGGISFTLPKLGMGGSAGMRLNPKLPAFLVDIGLELSTPILLGSTGLGIYGFRALVGQRYVASKAAAGVGVDDPWWQYYKAYPEGVNVQKFEALGGFSVGAGVSLATAPDAGKTFSSKLFFLLSLPGLFLFQGQAAIMKERIGLDTTADPPFFALLAITNTSIEAAFGANFKVPDSGSNIGKIVTVDGIIEMGYFWANASAWYVNIGKDQPEDRRIQARIVDLFNAYFYLMISSQGIRAGAGASYDLNKKFGPLRAELRAYLDVAGRISFKPKQIGGSIQLGGTVGLYIWKFGFKLSAHTSLAAEAPKPFIVTGTLEVCIRVLRKDRCAKFNFTWTFDSSLPLDPLPFFKDAPTESVQALNMHTEETFPIYANASASFPSTSTLENYLVPMDSFIDMEFLNGVLPSSTVVNKFGGNTQGIDYSFKVAPQKGKSDRVRHEFHLSNVEIYYHDPSSGWTTYDMYAAATPMQIAPFITTPLSGLPQGYWQFQSPNVHNKLRVMAMSPLSFLSQGSGSVVPENLGVTVETIFCGEDPIPKTCVDFDNFFRPDFGIGAAGNLVPGEEFIYHEEFLFRILSDDGLVTNRPFDDFTKALCVEEQNYIEIFFNEAVPCVDLLLYSLNSGASVGFYEYLDTGTKDSSDQPIFVWNLVQTNSIPFSDYATISFDDADHPVSKARIFTGICEERPPAGEGFREGESPSKGEGGEEPGGQLELPTNCDPKMTAEAGQLQEFLNTLARYQHWLQQGFTMTDPNYYGSYNGIFFNTSLYGSADGEKVQWTRTYYEPDLGIMHFNIISSSVGFQCDFTLEMIPPGPLDFSRIQAFSNLRPDPGAAQQGGWVYTFLIDAQLSSGITVTLRGTSCYPIIFCGRDCNLYLYEVCFQTQEEFSFNQTIPSFSTVQSETTTMINAFSGSIQPIWRPDTHFVIKVTGEDRLYRENGTSLLATPTTQTYMVGFKTTGPLGHFHIYKNAGGGNSTRQDYLDLQSADREDEYKLANIKHYINYERSYPNADGQLVGAKPLYYLDPELRMFYAQAYVYSMMADWDMLGNKEKIFSQLTLLLKDPAPEPGTTGPGAVSAAWDGNNFPVVSEDITVLTQMTVTGSPCATVTAISPIGTDSSFDLPALRPLKLYTAIFFARYKRNSDPSDTVREVHRYNFQTSQYPNFSAHIRSYILLEDAMGTIVREAKFTIEKSFSAGQVGDAADIINDTMPGTNSLVQQFAHPFDRLIDGVFELESIDPPQTLEFNLIKNSASGNILGILIRTPEPLNDPKTPATDLTDAITLSVNGGSTNLYTALHSKDTSSAFITNDGGSLNIPTAGSTLEFTFNMKLWDGNAYSNVATEIVTLTLV